MEKNGTGILEQYTGSLSHRIEQEYHIGEELYRGDIKRGLRNSDGTGVPIGVTRVGSVLGYMIEDGVRIPVPASCITGALSSMRSWRPTGRRGPLALKRWPICCSWAICPPGGNWTVSMRS